MSEAQPPLIRIDLASAIPAYEQIAGAIRGLLLAGQLRPGDGLPPVRQLASDLAVHFNTVAQAYRILAQEGWLDVRQGRGATVLARDAEPAKPAAKAAVAAELHNLVASALAQGVSPSDIRQECERLLQKFSARTR